MHHIPPWVLAPLVLLTGCGRNTTSLPPALQPPAAQAATASGAPAAAAPLIAAANTPRPEQRLSHLAARDAADAATPVTAPVSKTLATPESAEQAEALMARLDGDIADRGLQTGAAGTLRAGFRGRLLAAGIPPARIDAWVRGTL